MTAPSRWLTPLMLTALLGAQQRIERTVAAMGTLLRCEVVAASRAAALAASEAALRAVDDVERRLSVWRDDSDVARVNRAAVGVAVPLAPATAADLAFAFATAARCDRCFDPAIGPLVQAYRLRDGGDWPDEPTVQAALAAAGEHAFAFGATWAVRRLERAALDCDAFGKGLALDRAGAAALVAGARGALFDFGGQVASHGDVGRELWVPVADPDDRERIVAEILLAPGSSAATSGNGERRERPAGRPLGHLLDPRTGRPAADFGSATAVAPAAALADAAGTAFFVHGPGGPDVATVAMRLGADVLFVERAGAAGAVRLRATRGLAGRVRAGLAIHFFPPSSTRP